MTAVGCAICDTLPLSDLVDLDLTMGDATRWPANVWGVFDKPKAPLSPRRQWYGGTQAGILWLKDHGYDDRFGPELVRKHYRYDVTVIAADTTELINKGIIAASDKRSKNLPAPTEKIDPTAYLSYFNRGIILGNRGLQILEQRVEDMIAKDEEVPLVLLLKIADIGTKLATTQAVLKTKGLAMGDPDDSDEGFRAGSVDGGIPSKRVGHQRVRVIEGEARPVTDEGPADREHFSERSVQEGGEGLPH